ncbi:TPA: glycosyltransferase family 4 protein [Raoultella ornithinolytica]|uniref:glycosyltransferase family 4 protein n=1 Tax=Raoultella ornithinolytica TaxID=54291 RepID=UPI0015DCB345|nr:glycosyltransferase family 1 protein [Raoultella ornithinolytica]QLK20767.1 glycosyltransferase [Raoultella ornithinolytica]WKL85374.1 glycosyltransferase family 1 protein [Raoultella ornithinolytica]HAT2374445.1 glycosyltransferase family 4 protein [Raoultella ornithinolytica]HAU5002261.1 glycosyltransferase family 4 protein [Raoultella ornithinolytica]HCD1179781.1 glycosyltransferase family 4 protein [Raoultella ornithinolytica]
MILNLTRIGKSGTGMWEYSKRVADLLSKKRMLTAIVCSKSNAEYFKSFDVEVIKTPDIVANSSKISKLRPIYWLLYSFYLSAKLKAKYRDELIMSTTHHSLPLIRKQIITIHDIRPRKYPDSTIQFLNFKYLIPRVAKKVKHIITVSNAVKEQLVSVYGLDKNKISVVYNAVTENLGFNEKPTSKERDMNKVLMIGASWRHKNAHLFISNYMKFENKIELIVVSGKTNYQQELIELVKKEKLEKRVTFLSNLSDAEIGDLYTKSTVLVYPSKDEGFGIPPIEAMSKGLPVIVSNIPVFKEILSTSAIYVEPESYSSWKDSFAFLSDNRDSLINSGYETSKKYNISLMSSMIDDFLDAIKRK